jgi:hypothetical protein
VKVVELEGEDGELEEEAQEEDLGPVGEGFLGSCSCGVGWGVEFVVQVD